MSFSHSFAAGPATTSTQPHHHHDDRHHHRRRRRGHDDSYPYTTLPYHTDRDPLSLTHFQDQLFPPPPPAYPSAGPPPPKRPRRLPDPSGPELRWEPPDAAAAVAPPPQEEEGAEALLSRDEIERRSPSRKDGIDSALEARLRASYCAYLRCLGVRLGLPQTTIATAAVLCHRFFFRRSHACHDRFLIATAALFLSAKSEETPCLLNTVLRASCEVSQNQEFTLLPYMLRGDWFEQYRERVIEAEQMILTTLDFELEVAHPYDSLSSALNKLGLSQTILFNVAWNLVNEGLRSSLWLQFKPHHIAAGATFLAAKFLRYDITFYPCFWHEFKTTPYIVQDVAQQLKELL